jgi:hypothetical protein
MMMGIYMREIYSFEVVFHWLIVVDIDQREDRHSFLIDLYRRFVVRIVDIDVLVVRIRFGIVFEFVRVGRFVDVNAKVLFDELEVLFERLRDYVVFYIKIDN